ncbi:MAG: FeoB-associated Cys-rich membrane protein [Eubacteriales bacterium]|nr:FeoB-associated Cys-rich membrane protein [Eubacteriales bacterium]
MTAFLAANLSTILICIVLIAIVVSISIYLVRQKKQGKSSCGAGCAHCAMHGECHSCRK